jgi:DNA polymerase elongation subunit (family B)
MDYNFRILDFNVYNGKNTSLENSSDDDTTAVYKETTNFIIQMFGVNETGKTCSILVENFKPFFYVLIDDSWNIPIKESFVEHIKSKIGKYYKDSITNCIIVKRNKLYGFDGGREYKFLKLEFSSMNAFNKVKNLWYTDYQKGHVLLKTGYSFNNTDTKLYEANIPPLLRFFHIKDISPSGWISLSKNKVIEICNDYKKTTCDYEFTTCYKNVKPINDKETRVPYKIMSFDIEASSSHGDFPVPIKSYKKLATNIVEYFENLDIELTQPVCTSILQKVIMAAFGYEKITEIDLVYPKVQPKNKGVIEKLCNQLLTTQVRTIPKENSDVLTLENYFQQLGMDEEDDTDTASYLIYKKHNKTTLDKKATIVDILCDKNFDRTNKLEEINNSLNSVFRNFKLEGDKVTFIGSTFMNYGEPEPYMNHCVVLNTCSKMENSIIESYDNERDVLLAWQKLVQRENPDIIIGYNIFGFDYNFMFQRAQENSCEEEFLKLSRNKDEICATKDRDTGKYKLEESTIQIASGQHDLKFIKINGRLQVDLYNFFRREENLTSYKLDYVAGHFIGDYVKSLSHDDNTTEIKTSNMTGLLEGSFVHFEEIGHSIDYYDGGAKYKVIYVNKNDGKFKIDTIVNPDLNKKVRWCLAKDDVTPKDIFRMTNGTDEDRAVIAKYCIQDCNLVHYLFNKADILTGFIEMAKICSVPINFLVMRGQGIKLTSYIAKKCREKNTLMPVIEKGELDDGYEGAIVLEPKCDLYLDNPVACVDYASLYPSSMISENLSHDSKVLSREYDLAGNLIEEWGEKDSNGVFIYDNLPNYEYVDITYDTYLYIRKTPSSAAEKVRSGSKTCRFAQFPDGKKAIMPSILEELLVARKTTRKMIPLQTDEFMKNVLDKRQLGYKVTANSLYGQCGAKTSTFYEKDIAACTTATGRMLLIYAKKIIEESYGDSICNTSTHGPVLTKAEYIYGDSVPKYTPIYISTIKNGDRVFDICTIEDLGNKYGNNNWIKCVEEGKQEKEFCELENVETWSEKGWTPLHRIIRHTLADHKKIIRILTHTGLVDVTDDHSLLRTDATEISPKDIKIGTELLHNDLPVNNNFTDTISKEEAQVMGFFFRSCGKKSGWALNNSKFVDNYKAKTIPCEVLMGSEEIRQAFWNGLNDADCDKDVITIDQKNQISAAQICWLAQSLGWKTSMNTIKDPLLEKVEQKNGFTGVPYYRITMTKKTQKRNPVAVKKIQEIIYEGYVYDLTTENHHFAAGIGNIIVHNTDSVFFTFNLQTPEGKPIRGKEALEITIELAQEAGHLASSFLKQPHDLEYEKTFMPFCLLSKKRYVGMLYETDPNKCKRKEMGIVLKRRDNAPIVKDIYGGIIDILMKQQNIKQAIDFLKSSLQNIVDEKFPMDKLIITKSLRSGYKNPNSIAHKVLADRITARDPGNKPSSGDRIAFVYVTVPNKKALQGEKIETPSYVLENGLKIDYSFYITNQIMKPVQQVFALVLEKMWEQQNKKPKIMRYKKDVEILRRDTDEAKFADKLDQLRNKEVKALLFDEYLREINNDNQGVQSLTKFFTPLKI